MKKTIFDKIAKIIIDIPFIPLRKSKVLLSYLFNNTLRKELEEMAEKGELIPLNHIHHSIRLANKFKQQDFIILDIGGGVGATVNIFNNSYPEKTIVVFEPINDNLNVIKSRFADFANIKIINYALGNENSTKLINIANRKTSSSLLPIVTDPDSQVFNEKTLGQAGSETIKIIRLDDYKTIETEKIGIMKIDVQGYEMEVLKGAEMTLLRTKIIVLEANNHNAYDGSPKYYEIDTFLRQHNFILYNIFPSIIDNEKLKEWDMIYLNRSAECELEL